MDLSNIDPNWLWGIGGLVVGYLYAKNVGANSSQQQPSPAEKLNEKLLNKVLSSSDDNTSLGYSVKTQIPMEVTLTPKKGESNG